jgi:sugar phosphate isomerase/epimerase
MIRSPLGLRLNPGESIRLQIQQAARIGAKGVVIDAIGDISPDRLTETGRRELRHLFRSTELSLVALHLPTRRSFDTTDQLDDRLMRAEKAFTLAYELGTKIILARVGSIPLESDAARAETFRSAVVALGQRAEHRGVTLAIETGPDNGSTVREFLDRLATPGLAASIDPGGLLQHGHDPVSATCTLAEWVIHAYANDATGRSRAGIQTSFGFPPGALDWEEYLGALEEINYRGFLTIWPDDTRDAATQYQAIARELSRF